jgi:phosphoglycolate phosphatase
MSVGHEQGALFLWDIDGTLISDSRQVNDQYAEAIIRVLQRDDIQPPEKKSGLTDYGIVERALMDGGYSAGEASLLIPYILFELDVLTREQQKDLANDRVVLEGVEELLTDLRNEQGVCHSVASGNSPARSHIKLEAMELKSYFDFRVGGFGNSTTERWRIIEWAFERARLLFSPGLERHRVVVIGDTPTDITAASQAGVRSIAVATGRDYSYGSLEAARPSLLIPNCADGAASVLEFASRL